MRRSWKAGAWNRTDGSRACPRRIAWPVPLNLGHLRLVRPSGPKSVDPRHSRRQTRRLQAIREFCMLGLAPPGSGSRVPVPRRFLSTEKQHVARCRNSSSMRRTEWTVVAAVPLLVLGCDSYGGRAQRITLVTDPPGATASVMTYKEWLANGGDRQMVSDELLLRHRVKAGLTPIVAEFPPYEHVFVADWSGHKEFLRFVPKAGREVKLSTTTTKAP